MRNKESREKRYFCNFHDAYFKDGNWDNFSTGMNVIVAISCILSIIVMGIWYHNMTKDNYYNEKLYTDLAEFVTTCIEEKDIEKLEKGVDNLAISYEDGEVTIECTRNEEHCSAMVATTIKAKLFSDDYEIIGQTRNISTENGYKVRNGIAFFLITFVGGTFVGFILSAILRLIIKIASIISYWHKCIDEKIEAKKQKSKKKQYVTNAKTYFSQKDLGKFRGLFK